MRDAPLGAAAPRAHRSPERALALAVFLEASIARAPHSRRAPPRFGSDLPPTLSAMAALASSRLAMRLALLLGLLGCAFAGKGVTLATDRTFDDVVLNSGKNAFVKFLAPW
jgi:hypothetical protein